MRGRVCSTSSQHTTISSCETRVRKSRLPCARLYARVASSQHGRRIGSTYSRVMRVGIPRQRSAQTVTLRIASWSAPPHRRPQKRKRHTRHTRSTDPRGRTQADRGFCGDALSRLLSRFRSNLAIAFSRRAWIRCSSSRRVARAFLTFFSAFARASPLGGQRACALNLRYDLLTLPSPGPHFAPQCLEQQHHASFPLAESTRYTKFTDTISFWRCVIAGKTRAHSTCFLSAGALCARVPATSAIATTSPHAAVHPSGPR